MTDPPRPQSPRAGPKQVPPDAALESDAQSHASPNSASPLCKIPLEVLLDITSDLTTVELGHMRLACKHIEASLLRSFSKEFFSRRAFLFSDFSLRTLVDISKSRFAPMVTAVTFGTFQPQGFQSNYSNPVLGSTTAQERHRLEELHSSQALFITDEILEYLITAFANLPNMSLVGIRDYHAAGRQREGPFKKWNCYGWNTYRDKTGTTFIAPRPDNAYISKVFWLVLRAAAETPHLSVRHFETYFRRTSCSDSVFLPILRKPSIFQPMLSKMDTLFLTVGLSEPHLTVKDSGGAGTKPCPSYHLQRFLKLTPKLERLRINCSGPSTHDYPRQLLSWLAQLPSPKGQPQDLSSSADVSPQFTNDGMLQPPEPIFLSELRELELGDMSIDPAIILDLLRVRGSRLKRLSLHKITLLGDSDVEKLKRNMWSGLFARMAGLGQQLGLKDIQVSLPSQQSMSIKRSVGFGENGERIKHWKGQSLSHALKDFKDKVKVEWPPPPGENSDNSMDDDEEDPLSESHHSDSDDDGDDDDDEL